MSALIHWSRLLTPFGWVAGIGVGAVVLAVLASGLGFRWDPLGLDRRRAVRAEASAEAARALAVARTAEAEAQGGQVDRLDAALTLTRSVDRATDRFTQAARTADDASLPLSADRIDRLGDHDRRLCGLVPDLGGCPAAPDPAADGEPTL